MQMINIIKYYTIKLYHSKVIRYLFTGGVSYLIELVLLVLFTQGLHIWYLYSNIISSVISLFVAYVINNYWTFQSKKIRMKKIVLLLVIHICNMAIGSALLYMFTTLLGIFYVLSKILTTCMSCVWNYFISKHIIYK